MQNDNDIVRIEMTFELFRDLLMTLADGRYDADPAIQGLHQLLDIRLQGMVKREKYSQRLRNADVKS